MFSHLRHTHAPMGEGNYFCLWGNCNVFRASPIRRPEMIEHWKEHISTMSVYTPSSQDADVQDSPDSSEDAHEVRDTRQQSMPSLAMQVRMRTAGFGGSFQGDDALSSPMRLASAF